MTRQRLSKCWMYQSPSPFLCCTGTKQMERSNALMNNNMWIWTINSFLVFSQYGIRLNWSYCGRKQDREDRVLSCVCLCNWENYCGDILVITAKLQFGAIMVYGRNSFVNSICQSFLACWGSHVWGICNFVERIKGEK